MQDTPAKTTFAVWYFWDETWADAIGPYPTEELAVEASTWYGKWLNSGEEMPQEVKDRLQPKEFLDSLRGRI